MEYTKFENKVVDKEVLAKIIRLVLMIVPDRYVDNKYRPCSEQLRGKLQISQLEVFVEEWLVQALRLTDTYWRPKNELGVEWSECLIRGFGDTTGVSLGVGRTYTEDIEVILEGNHGHFETSFQSPADLTIVRVNSKDFRIYGTSLFQLIQYFAEFKYL